MDYFLSFLLWGRVDDFSFFACGSPIFLLIEFHWTFALSYKILTNYVYYYCILIRCLNRNVPSGLLSFEPALLLSIITPLCLPSSSVYVSCFILAVPMRECSGKHSCMSSSITYGHTEWYLLFWRIFMIEMVEESPVKN